LTGFDLPLAPYALEVGMSVSFLIGSILGSGLFIFAGRAPARKLLAIVQSRFEHRKER
jgi:hypothetical protein